MMNAIRKNRLITVLFIVFILLLAALLYISQGGSSSQGEPDDLIDYASAGDGQSAADEPESVAVFVSGLLAYKSLEDLKTESTLVVHGRVTGVSEPFLIKPVNGGEPMYHTDYYITIIDTYRGEPGDTEEISVRVLGGSGNKTGYEMMVVSDSEAQLEKGEEYLLFLFQTKAGGGYSTKGDYYDVTGASQGAYVMADAGVFVHPDSGEKIVADKFKAEMEEFNKTTPVDTDFYRNTLVENLNENLRTGGVSRESYNQMIKEMDVYAQIIE